MRQRKSRKQRHKERAEGSRPGVCVAVGASKEGKRAREGDKRVEKGPETGPISRGYQGTVEALKRRAGAATPGPA